jgi:hypothetical protein
MRGALFSSAVDALRRAGHPNDGDTLGADKAPQATRKQAMDLRAGNPCCAAEAGRAQWWLVKALRRGGGCRPIETA